MYANELVETGHEVVLVLLHKRPIFYKIDSRVKIYENPFNRRKGNLFLYIINTFFFIRKTIRNLRPCVAISNGEWINSFVFLSLLFLDTKVFLVEHSNPDLNLGILHQKGRAILYRFANGIIVLTERAKTVLGENLKLSNIYVVPNPINFVERISVDREDIVVSIGRLSKVKGLDNLIRSFKATKEVSWTLSIVGEGPERKYLESLVEDLDMKDRVLFHGRKENIDYYLSQSKIFVLSSLSENSPMALMEAMSVPLACIATDCMSEKGEKSLIQDNVNGLLVEPGDISALSQAMKKLMIDDTLRSKCEEEAYKIRKEYNIEANCSRLLEVICR